MLQKDVDKIELDKISEVLIEIFFWVVGWGSKNFGGFQN